MPSPNAHDDDALASLRVDHPTSFDRNGGLLGPDGKLGPPPLTREEQQQRATRLRVAFPDAQATLEDIFAEGDRVAYRLTIHGTHTGEFLGVAASGRPVAVSFIAIVRIADGKLVEEWGGLDQPDLIRQMRGSPSAP